MSNKLFFVLVIIAVVGKSFGQSTSIGFRVEPFFLVDGHRSNDIWAHKLTDGRGVFWNSFSVVTNISVAEHFNTSLRVGYLGSREQGYNGIELSSYLFYTNSNSNLRPLIGAGFHFNKGESTGNISVYNKTIFFASVGLEKEITTNFILGCLLELPIDSEFNRVYTNIPHTTYAKYIIKLVVGYEFNL